MKFYADTNRSERSFKVGNMVYLRVRLYRQLSMTQSKYSKLDSKYYGPFLLLARVGSLAYRLQLPMEARIHPVFHVFVLKKKIGVYDVVSPMLPPVNTHGQFVIEPIAILDRKLVKCNFYESPSPVVQHSALRCYLGGLGSFTCLISSFRSLICFVLLSLEEKSLLRGVECKEWEHS